MSAEAVLRAMAANYPHYWHIWDRLDAKACASAADEISDLRAQVAALTEQRDGWMRSYFATNNDNNTLTAALGKVREALGHGLEYASHALQDFDAQYQRHPSLEDSRKIIVDDIGEINEALAAIDEACGFPFKVSISEKVPPGEAWMIVGGQVVGRITNIDEASGGKVGA